MEIKIGKNARICNVCDRKFTHDEDFRSLARFDGVELVREDYCETCWDPAHSTGVYSVWSPRFYDPNVAEQEAPEVFSPLRQTFYESVESNERQQLSVAYLAAQLLRRQKAFRLIKESPDPDSEVNLILFSDRIGNRLIEVSDPSLSYEELEQGQVMLMERLRELESPDEPVGDEPAEDGIRDAHNGEPQESVSQEQNAS